MDAQLIQAESEILADEQEVKPEKLLVYWAFADKYSGQWFICKSRRKRFKQLILLFKLGCVPSEKELYIPEKAPVVGGVYNDTDRQRIECKEVEWV